MTRQCVSIPVQCIDFRDSSVMCHSPNVCWSMDNITLVLTFDKWILVLTFDECLYCNGPIDSSSYACAMCNMAPYVCFMPTASLLQHVVSSHLWAGGSSAVISHLYIATFTFFECVWTFYLGHLVVYWNVKCNVILVKLHEKEREERI
jgi:hypothetical protein